MSNNDVVPFVKWAGGKRQLLDRISERLPKTYDNYFEPFVGGGAVLFELQPSKAIINDINEALINAYRVIADSPNEFMESISEFDFNIVDKDKEYYYFLRSYYNNKLINEEFDIELAALFVFLNKHCFNGLYRVNGKGLFNVPYNNSKKRSIEPRLIFQVSEYLKKVTILQGDFEEACNYAQKGDFIFFDSPYAPLSPTSFESYTKEGFDVESHIRLANLFDNLTEKGCYCMLTNHNTELINELYSNKGYRRDVVNVKRMINSDASKRVGEEVIICNY